MTIAKKSKIKRIRWLWWGKWSGVLCCALIAGLWVLSAYDGIVWSRDHPDGTISMMTVMSGLFEFETTFVPVVRGATAPQGSTTFQTPGWDFFQIDPPRWFTPALPRVGPGLYIFPLWIPLAVFALPTIGLFILDRRRHRPGHCDTCGYDLTGNSSGKCPECGATTPARAAT